MTRNRVEEPREYICMCVCVCVYVYIYIQTHTYTCVCGWVGVKMPFVRFYSMRLHQLQNIIRPSIQNIVRICKQIITVTLCEASNRLANLKFVNSSTQILYLSLLPNCFIVTDFISYILSYLYLTYRPILITYSHSNQCNLA